LSSTHRIVAKIPLALVRLEGAGGGHNYFKFERKAKCGKRISGSDGIDKERRGEWGGAVSEERENEREREREKSGKLYPKSCPRRRW
jgi:hypothetical protein